MTAPRPVVTVDREALEYVIGLATGDEPSEAGDGAIEALAGSLADAPAAGQVLELDGVGILLDAYGVALGMTTNTERPVMVMDLGGALSGTAGAERVRHRYVMPAAVAAELVVALLGAGRSDVSREAFLEALETLQPGWTDGRPD